MGNKITPKDLVQIKNFLQTLKGELLNITIISHSKKKNSYQQANYHPKRQTLFVDFQILDEMKKYRIEIIKKIAIKRILLYSKLIILTNKKTTLKINK